MKYLAVTALVSVLFIAYACDNVTDTPEAMTIRITHPMDSIIVAPDSTIRIMTEVTSPCGCSMHTEFRVNGVHVYSDYLAYYTMDWTAPDVPGWYKIDARAVKDDNSVDAWDSIHVLVSATIAPGSRGGLR